MSGEFPYATDGPTAAYLQSSPGTFGELRADRERCAGAAHEQQIAQLGQAYVTDALLVVREMRAKGEVHQVTAC